MSKKILRISCYIASFIIPSVIFLFTLSANKITPFGDGTLLMVDLQGQYISMLSYLGSVFRTSNDFIYTLTKSLGGDMVSILTYYLLSPFNFIYVFVSSSALPVTLSIVTTLKIGACGLTFFALMQYVYKKPLTGLVFSISYALCAYVIVYHSNIMWIDGVIFLPLVVLGIKQLFDGKKAILYVVSLALAIFSNYYIGFMICIASVVFFLFELYRKKREKKDIKQFFSKFLTASILAGALSAISWLTAILAMTGSKTQIGSGNVTDFSLIINFTDAIGNLSGGSYAGISDIISGSPLVFCGCLSLYLLVMYFANNSIEKNERYNAAYILAGFILIFSIRALDNLMHGGAAPTWFPYRYAFIFSFFIIYFAARGFNKLEKGFSPYQLILVLALIVIQFIINRFSSLKNNLDLEIVLYIIFAAVILFNHKFKHFTWSKYVTIGVLLTINIVDMSKSTSQVISTNAKANNYLSYKTYKDDINEIGSLIDYVKEYDQSGYQYRMEKTFYRNSSYNYANNDAMMFDYAGLSHYSSSDKLNVRSYMSNRLGFHSNPNWTSYAQGSTIAANSLLNVKYIIDRDQFYNSGLISNRNFGGRDHLNLINTVPATDSSGGNYYTFENPYALGMGYMVKPSTNKYGRQGVYLADNSTYWFNIFEYQNYMFKDLANLPVDDDLTDADNNDIFKKAGVSVAYTNLEPLPENPKRFKLTNLGEVGRITYTVTIDSSNNFPYYYYVSPFYKGQMTVLENGVSVRYENYYNQAINPIKRNASTTRTYTLLLNANTYWETVELNAFFYYEDTNVLKQYTDNLQNNSLQIKKISSSHYKGEVTYNKAKPMLMMTFPFESSWKISINGKSVKTRNVQELFLGADLSSLGFSDGQTLKVDLRYAGSSYTYAILIGLVAIGYIAVSWYHLDKTVLVYVDKFKNKKKPNSEKEIAEPTNV